MSKANAEVEVVIMNMTKREWFAGMALQGMLGFMSVMPDGEQDYSYIASHCFDIADAMMEEGAK